MLYEAGSSYVAFRMNCEGAPTAMSVVVPDLGKMADVKASLSPTWYSDLGGNAHDKPVNLRLPKFSVRGGTESLSSALVNLGLVDASNPPVAAVLVDLRGLRPAS